MFGGLNDDSSQVSRGATTMIEPGNGTAAVTTRGLRKSFGRGAARIEAVRHLDMEVARGEIFGFLGPNGAGKTTTLRMLTTLLSIDGGEAIVAGVDVARQPREARRRIGYVGQLGGADQPATGRENLVLQGELYGLSGAHARLRAAELIDQLELAEFADRVARTYSGGQRRRLEVALGLVHRPDVLFLDEPTSGLDPQNRAHLWDQVRALRASGTTIFLTTHYLEEADALADRLAIIDHGQLVACGTPAELKEQLASASMVIEADLAPGALEALRAALAAEPTVTEARVDGRLLRVDVTQAAAALPPIATLVAARQIPLQAIALSQPSLDDVFLHLTGRSLRDAGLLTSGDPR
jgi:ABC-2 type transport system ATP-binding protein